MTMLLSLAVGLGLILTGCAYDAPASALPDPHAAAAAGGNVDASFTLGHLNAFVHRFGAQDAAAQRAEIARLQGLAPRSAGDRLMLAYLLSLDNASPADLMRAEEQLEGLEFQFGDPATRLFVHMLQRTVAAERALRKEKKRAADLQEKLQQIKKLERDLQERNQADLPPQGK